MLSKFLTQGVRFTTYAILLCGCLVCPAPVLANQGAVALAWDPSLDPTVTGYNVYYGTASRAYTNVVPAGGSTTAIVSNLVTGVTYYFAATTYNVAGLESDYSAEASYALQQPNQPPTLDSMPDLTISQDAGLQSVLLTGITSGATNEIQPLTVSAFSSNPGLIQNPVVTYSSPETTGTLTFSPTPGSFGSTIITVMVDDGGTINNTVIRSFAVTVNPLNNPPTLDLLNDLAVNENSGLQTVSLTGISSGSTNGNQTLIVTAVSSNPSLIASPTVNYASPAPSGTLTLIPATNSFGISTITVTVSDSQPTNNSTSVSFGVTVTQTVVPQAPLTNATVFPNKTFAFRISPPATNGDKLNISLDPGAPSGAKITTRKGISWLLWTPTTAQASTTNFIDIQITDVTNPSLSTNEIVSVVVLDYVGLAIGSTSVQAGQGGSVSIAVSSSEGVTNLAFAMPWPTNLLPNPTLSITAPGVLSSSLQYQITNVLVTLQMSPGQVLQGSNVIGSLSFQSLASQPSGYVSLPVSSLTASKPTSLPYANLVPTAGQVAVINNLAMLQATATATPSRTLTVLGKVGNSYQVQFCTNLGPSAVWYSFPTYSQTNIAQIFNVDPAIPQVLYRVQQK